MGNVALNSGMGVTRWIRHAVDHILIPRLTEAEPRPFVGRILDAKGADAAAYPETLEAKLEGWYMCGAGLRQRKSRR